VRRRLPFLLLVPVLVAGFAFHAYRAEHPTTHYQSADERSYGKLAVNLATSGHYGDPASGMRDPLHWPPGAPVLFAVGQRLFPSASAVRTFDLPAAYWLQALISTGTAACAFGLAWIVAGPWAGLVAAALVAGYPPLILATGEQLSEPLGAFFVIAAALALALAARERGGPVLRHGAWALAGALFGCAVLTRADLLLVPWLVAGLVVVWQWRARHAPRRGVATGALVLAGAGLVVLPWSAYASARAGELVPVTRGSASALFVGTYLPGNGTTVGMKRALGTEAKRLNPKLRGTPDFELEARSVLAVAARRHPDLPFNTAVGLEARRNLVRYSTADPVGFGKMMLNKVQRMWTRYARGGARHTSPVLRAWHIALVGFAMVGLVLGLVRSPRPLVLGAVALAVAYSTAIHMLVVSQARYNLPLVPALVACGVAGWALWWRRRRAPAPARAGEDATAAAQRAPLAPAR
jgi:4-amino-4-deoxy-L-arabinose transferase-like glycosyltransferase